jgi:hypothetical protein
MLPASGTILHLKLTPGMEPGRQERNMALLAFFGVGVFLGMRYRVLVLIPSIAGVVVLEMALGIGDQQSLRSIALFATAGVVSLQIGYWAGIAIRYLLSSMRVSVYGDINIARSRPLSHKAN